MCETLVDSVFVYGTLKRNEERGDRWPRQPRRIVPARIRATLYDLGPYPAIVPGADWVVGERWELAINDMPATLRLLDTIEGYRQDGPDGDLYLRKVIPCHDLVSSPIAEDQAARDAAANDQAANDQAVEDGPVEYQADDGTERAAYAYFLAELSDFPNARRVSPDRDGYCRWSARG